MVRETMTGVVGMTEAYMQGQGGLPGQRARPLAPGPKPLPQGAPVQPGASAYSTIDIDEEPAQAQQVAQPAAVAPQPVAQPAEVDDDMMGADQMEAELLKNATVLQRAMIQRLPADFQTQEWRIIVLALHQAEQDETGVETVANFISGHIAHLINFGLPLPEALRDVQTDPARALDRVLAPLPIAKSAPEFARAVLESVIEALHDDGFLEEPPSVIDNDGEELEVGPQPPQPQQASA